ncbi:hypothetical protein P3102_07550 [Amycolatopsis sp. QT-25]|uniref:hypothetical protein n=1 Tax=Amycolatopsis sp. QT-25 TaxID=3034022 RepID=UPI0023EB07D3|nr:hypothetical protein [Amycolatopsis sp. QT-25]WET81074.1 hypothetical protein P3102_07550 [Amycolatopsis sp. QT-25]
MAVELFSSEGLREPVLQRTAEDSRVLCVGVNYNAERRLAYADRAGPIGPFPAPLRTMPEWDLLERVAARLGRSIDEWSDENVPASSIEFLGRACGRPVDDEVMTKSGLVSVMLPLLPATFSVDVPVRSQLDVRVAALTESGSDEQLRPAVARQVQEMLREALVDSDAVRSAVAASGDHAAEVTDESAAGRDLRAVLAEQYLLAGSAPARHTSKSAQGTQPNPEQVQRRVSASVVAAALLRGGPQAALAEMLHRRAGTAWRDDLIEDLAVVVTTPAAVAKATMLLEEHLTRHAASRPVPGLRAPVPSHGRFRFDRRGSRP